MNSITYGDAIWKTTGHGSARAGCRPNLISTSDRSIATAISKAIELFGESNVDGVELVGYVWEEHRPAVTVKLTPSQVAAINDAK